MTNAEWMISQGMQFGDLEARFHGSLCFAHYRIYYRDEEIGATAIIPQNSAYALLHWLDEDHQEVILQDSEKEYLRTIVRPFKGEVEDIVKWEASGDREYISIEIFNEYPVIFPCFPKGSKYKGMETGKKYTIKKLGI